MAARKAIIVESPTKTRTLSRFLGDDYKLLASRGHVRDLPADGMAVDIEHNFEPTYVVPASAKKTIASLRKALKDVDEVYLATDPDREGEAIAWHLREALGLEGARRITFNEITEEAVREALSHPGEIDADLVNAQQARRVLDRIVGYELSPLVSRRVAGSPAAGLSAGRVQSAALRLICDRERERAEFEPEEYWSVKATLTPTGEEQAFEAELKTIDGQDHGLTTEEQVTPVVEELREQTYRVGSVERQQVRRNPPAPFRTSTLQAAAANRLRFSARKTLMIAQQLYEGIETGEGTHGLITYMRTDSTRIADVARTQAVGFIEEQFGDKYIGPGAKGKQAKGAQDAHEAIRPTSVHRTPEAMKKYLDKDQLVLYTLIWERFVASQMAPAVFDQTGVNIEAGRFVLRATGSVVVFPGFFKVLGRPEDDTMLPELEEGQDLALLDIVPEQHFTQPPPRFTEATLVRELENNGVGRPSTYASIIETLRQRKYVRMEKRAFAPTPLGLAVNDYLVDSFPEIMDIEFTAGVEEQLDTVESGERDWVALLREFYGPFAGRLERAAQAPPKVLEDEVCPQCGGKLLERYSRRGKFAGCENYPDCDYTRDLSEGVIEMPQVEETQYQCPECGSPLVIRPGSRGRFFACTGYPNCRWTANVGEDGSPQQRQRAQAIGEDCPECGKPLAVREGRRGKFVGCSGYPKCRYTRDWDGNEAAEQAPGPKLTAEGKPAAAPKPEKLDEQCPECNKPLLVRQGKRGKFVGCSGYPSCRYTREMDAPKEETDAE
ncbi:MAG TPA: type I DNA topoisomerase [Armatimonadota bacterium]|nr:type I DNA topoisomerase [Armatimonadota bacterium]